MQEVSAVLSEWKVVVWSQQSAASAPSVYVRRQSLPVWQPTLNKRPLPLPFVSKRTSTNYVTHPWFVGETTQNFFPVNLCYVISRLSLAYHCQNWRTVLSKTHLLQFFLLTGHIQKLFKAYRQIRVTICAHSLQQGVQGWLAGKDTPNSRKSKKTNFHVFWTVWDKLDITLLGVARWLSSFWIPI